ncbi:hypothetical protein NC653_012777 [Populus alba x Populus x berolinensis]|uniref:F-box domain-containing protein n=1 Tax=Populus alba x Populus x berolinensis TaxID=444605 RepID=A0AAD6QT51_9ROSI|nr:hypothetical protein NC653_012777 [Populus alba x Populus x berolinensis]
MDSHVSLASFTCRDTLIMILRKLGARDLARASCVCKLWRDMASDDAIVRPAFMEPWKLKEIVGEPVSASFWRENGIWKFAISHKIARGDSVTSLAKKYSVQLERFVLCRQWSFCCMIAPYLVIEKWEVEVRDIKFLNNISDSGINSRERLLIPIINPNSLINGICYIEFDTDAKKEVLVLYPGGQPDKKLVSKGSSILIFSRPQAGEGFRVWLAGNRKHAVHRKSTALNQTPSLYCVVFLNLYDVNKNQVVPRDICSPRHSDDDARTSMSLFCGQLPQLWLPFLYSLMDPANLVVSSSNQRLKASSQLGPAMTMIPPGISFTVRERSPEVFHLEHRGLVPISLGLRKIKRDREMGDDRFIDAVPDTTRYLNFQAIDDVNELKKG